jgi:hypothetical protein
MQFRLLGPLEVAEQNTAAALGGVKQRSLPGLSDAPDDPGTRLRWSLTGAGS